MTALNPTLVGNYTDLLKFKTFEVYWNPAKAVLSARICDLSTGIIIDNLPVTEVPAHLLKERNVQTIKAYFQHTYLASEKGVDGAINRVSAHIIAPAAGKGVIPFQPGLALGSVVKAETIDQIEKFADLMAAQQNLDDQIRQSEQQLTNLELQRQSRIAQKPELKKIVKSDGGKDEVKYDESDIRLKAINDKIGKLQGKIETLYKQKFDTPEVDLPIFTNLQTSAASPIDMGKSTIESQPRAFDTLDFNSQYIKMSESDDAIQHQVSQSSNSINVSGNASYLLCNVGAKYARAQAIANRVAQIKKQNIAQGTLIINATVTTRYVRCFTKLTYNRDKLKTLLDAMNKGDKKALDRYGISSPSSEESKESKGKSRDVAGAPKILEAILPEQKKEDKGPLASKDPLVYIVSEGVMAASFTALVTFLDESKIGRDAEIKQSESGQEVGVNVKLGISKFSTDLSGGYSDSNASNSENDKLKSLAQTKVEIELSVEGVIPQFERNAIEREVISHVNLDPTKFERSKSDDADAENLVKAQGEDKLVELQKRRIKMENAQAAILNTLRGLTFLKESQKIHTMDSVMSAYDSFLEKVTKDPNCGVPIGFNYDILTKSEIERILGLKA